MRNTQFHITDLSPLYETVQQSGIFADSKYFVDAVPKATVAHILAEYSAQKDVPSFDLRSFISEYFDLPAEANTTYSSAQKPLRTHLEELWQVLQREPTDAGGTLIALPFPYIVPGGRFREIYYWDSYFTMLGLAVSNRYDLIENMVKNFAFLIHEIGHIPNGNRTYYISRSQPPFFCMMVGILQEVKGNTVLEEYLPALEKEYAFWMDGTEQLSATNAAYRRVVQMPDGAVLNRYWDDDPSPRPEAYIEDLHVAKASNKNPQEVYRHIRAAAESGWDFSSRWFEDGKNMHTIRTTELVPVDLNCLLLNLERTLLDAYLHQKNEALANAFTHKIESRVKAIQQYCWNTEAGYYFDYHIHSKTTTNHITMAGCFPLFTGIASTEQANAASNMIREQLLGDGGVLTTTLETGQQWDAPNGWAPLQWIAYKGLSNYQQNDLAETIRERWTKLNEQTYADTGKMMEKYNVQNIHIKAGGGEYPNQDGFGWTNGAYLAMMNRGTEEYPISK